MSIDETTRLNNFKRQSSLRRTIILNNIRLLSDLTDKKLYSYSDVDIKEMFDKLFEELKGSRKIFKKSLINNESGHTGELTRYQKTALTKRIKYGDDFFRNIGAKGGEAKVKKGFSLNPELASRVSRGKHKDQSHTV